MTGEPVENPRLEWQSSPPHGTGWWWLWLPGESPQVVRVVNEGTRRRVWRCGSRAELWADAAPTGTRWAGPLWDMFLVEPTEGR